MDTRFLQGSLRTRLTRFIGVPASIFFFATLVLVIQQTFQNAVTSTGATAQNLARIQAAKLDGNLAEAARVPYLHARVLESGLLRDEAALRRYLTDVLEKTPGIYGSCLAFEPESFLSDERNFCPYAYRNNGEPEFVLLKPPEYDHFVWDWYLRPKALKRPLWTEPFFDEGGGNVLMTTHAVPFNHPDTGEFWGVATIDIALDALLEELSRLRIADTGYALLLSPEGRILACPDKSKVMKTSLAELDPDLAASLESSIEGFIEATDPLKPRPVRVAFAAVPGSGFTLALVYPTNEVFREARQQLIRLVAIGAAGVLLLFLVLVYVARSISAPVARLADAAREVASGNLDQPIEERFNIDEVRDLAAAFEKMTADLRLRMEELKTNTALTARLAGELNAARRIQMSMLPGPWGGDSSEKWKVGIHAIIEPAREVGGDFYDYRRVDDEHVSILVGDVSGKGIPAALYMAMTQTLFKGLASSTDAAAADVMARVNRALCDEGHTGMFVTLIYGVLHLPTGELDYCNAGHLSPMLLRAGKPVRPLESDVARNPALGLIPDLTFSHSRLLLQAGDRLVFYTDGVTEALDRDQKLYTVERLWNLLSVETVGANGPAEIADKVLRDVRSHGGGEDLSDDLTILVVEVGGRLPG